MEYKLSSGSLILLFIFSYFFSSFSYAGVITYDEITDGDLSDGDTFLFEEGVNSISGRTSMSLVSVDWDEFMISVADGFAISSITYSIYEVPVIDSTLYYVNWEIMDDITWLRSKTFDMNSENNKLFSSILPITAGDYHFGMTAISAGIGLNGQPPIGDWNLQFEVVQYTGEKRRLSSSVSVPEPSTLAIFALGMIGLASHRFKKLYE
ncbi:MULTISPECIES: PEP-CTERM sorting domain-containing protein [unclassified Colwellia]|uniref:PEP-CTERM sorting domain-containing protein n=1 Tax=unclassified Colwellia TaxID=196834 RepID=UPI002174DE22|nr:MULTISPECIES: PEP-CTERM sorting domain-containing protein [unclassified Colwellia]